jgi:hypothetical protein
LLKARQQWRGGGLIDALSNSTMHRSANRIAHMASMCRSRPLMVSVRPAHNKAMAVGYQGFKQYELAMRHIFT